ncbi:condensation domain-containing protein, partial [Kitasatospora sp. LaBMicrA B282]|uniref:condensation domain-containing protein n=1 Tax=Kitasatospora sp. LaBMicrA B282 TaxID=3420949 RepID=UPI003D130D4E
GGGGEERGGGGSGKGAERAPGDAFEERVAAVFAAVLGYPTVPLEAGFFDLGGSSLQLGAVCTRLSGATGVPVPVSVAMRQPTARALARWIEAQQGARGAAAGEGASAEVAASGPVESGPAASGPVPLNELQTSFWTRQAMDPADLSALCPLAWRITGRLDQDALAAALLDVVARHEALRSRYELTGRGREARPVAVPFPVSELPQCAAVERLAPVEGERSAVELLRERLLRPLAPEAGEVWRAVTVPVAGTPTVLFGLAFHHLAFDGHSEPVLVRELAAGYAARTEGRSDRLPAAPTLRQLAAATAANAEVADLTAQREHWQRTLRGIPELPLPAPAVAPVVADAWRFALDGERGAAVRELARQHGGTPSTLLLAATATALRQLTEQHDFGIGIPVAQRSGELLEAAIGCLVNTVCVRVAAPAGSSWAELVDRTREAATAALAAQDVPLAEVVRLVNPRRTGRSPLYQALFAYQDAPDAPLRLPGAQVAPVRIPPAGEGLAELVVEVRPEAAGGYLVEVTGPVPPEEFREAFLAALAGHPAAPGVRAARHTSPERVVRS